MTNDQFLSVCSRMREVSFELKELRKVLENQNILIERTIKIQEELIRKAK